MCRPQCGSCFGRHACLQKYRQGPENVVFRIGVTDPGASLLVLAQRFFSLTLSNICFRYYSLETLSQHLCVWCDDVSFSSSACLSWTSRLTCACFVTRFLLLQLNCSFVPLYTHKPSEQSTEEMTTKVAVPNLWVDRHRISCLCCVNVEKTSYYFLCVVCKEFATKMQQVKVVEAWGSQPHKPKICEASHHASNIDTES